MLSFMFSTEWFLFMTCWAKLDFYCSFGYVNKDIKQSAFLAKVKHTTVILVDSINARLTFVVNVGPVGNCYHMLISVCMV